MGAERGAAVLGGGCFWCLEAVFEQLRGVERVESGYAGGHVEHPTYEAVCTGRTGHAEVVRVTYDPRRISYRDLLEVFFTIHDPTTKDRQGADVGSQYRSIVLHGSDEERRLAVDVMRDVEAAGLWEAPLVTELRPLETFWPAEAEHQGYYRRNPQQGYCRLVIAPKVASFRKRWDALLRPS